MKDKNTAIVLAIFLGGAGLHQFYLKNYKSGLIYLVFSWTFIPAFLALIDAYKIFVTSSEEFDVKYNNYFANNKSPNNQSGFLVPNEKIESSFNEGSEFEIGADIQLGKDFIRLNEYSLTIRREGTVNFLIHGLKGEKDIYYKNITSIQIKKAGSLTGFIQFELLGSSTSLGGLSGAMSDENTVALYTQKHNEIAQQIKSFIESKLFAKNGSNNTDESNHYSELRELKKLLDENIITEEEFKAKKEQIMNE